MAQESLYGDTQRGSVDDVFQSFPDYESGRRAQRDLWKTRDYQKRTVREAIRRWSPQAEEAHVNEMLAAANASNGEKLMSEVSDTELNALMDVQQKWEGWHPGAMHGPPVDDSSPSRAFRLNNPGNIKRTDTMRQNPTPSTRPTRTGDPANTGQSDADTGRVMMAYDGEDLDEKAIYGVDGTVGPIWVLNADRQAAFDRGFAIWAGPAEPTVDPVEPVNWRDHVWHAMQTAGIDSPENAFNTLAESLPTLGAIGGGGATGGWGAIPGYAAGQGARELIQNRSDILPAIIDVAGHITSSADSPDTFIQNRPDVLPGYASGQGAADDPYSGRTFPSPGQAAWDAFKGGVMGDIVNLVPGARRGRQALQSLDEGNPWTAGTQGVIAGLDALAGFGGGAIARGIQAAPLWRNLLAAGAGGTGSAVGGELAKHAGEDWLDLTPDQQYALSALGEFGGGGVAGGLAHPSSSRVMGDIVTHPVVAATGAGLAASAHLPPQAAAGVAALSGIAAAAARRRTREAGTAERRAQQTEETATTREATRQRERGENQEIAAAKRAEDQARADLREATRQRERAETQETTARERAERIVREDVRWNQRTLERMKAAETKAELDAAKQEFRELLRADKIASAEQKAALQSQAEQVSRARERELREGLEPRPPDVVEVSRVTEDGVTTTTRQRFGKPLDEEGGPAGEAGSTPTEPRSDTSGLTDSQVTSIDDYNAKTTRALDVAESLNYADPRGKRLEELTSKTILTEAQDIELNNLRQQLGIIASDLGLRYAAAGTPSKRDLRDPTIRRYGDLRRRVQRGQTLTGNPLSRR
jgi:hypothetical protein